LKIAKFSKKRDLRGVATVIKTGFCSRIIIKFGRKIILSFQENIKHFVHTGDNGIAPLYVVRIEVRFCKIMNYEL
jgi:hypothetical protein